MPYEVNWGFANEPKIAAFLDEFPFIEEKYWKLLRSGSGMIDPKVQRMDTNFLRKFIMRRKWWERLLLMGVLSEGILLLDTEGNKVTEVGEHGEWKWLPYAHDGGWRRVETVYEALRRIGSKDIDRVKYAFYYYNRGRVPLLVVYKTPKDGTLYQLIDRYEVESSIAMQKKIAAT